MSLETYTHLLIDANPEFPIHFLNIYSTAAGPPGRVPVAVALHIERRGFLHCMWRYRMEVHGSLSPFTLPKMNAEVSVRA